MNRGYMNRILNVNLTTGSLQDETLDEKQCRDFIGGYGLGVRWLFERMPGKVDPLGPANILGLLTGPLTGTPCITGNRWVAVCKSPITNGWGDANCGGNFGPYLKWAGYDGLLFYGASDHPVYLWIDEGKAELRDASHLWGMDTNETEDALKAELGDKRKIQVASIGQAGENLCRMAAIINDYGRAAGRSGVGAVMGSKQLKAVAVRGNLPIPIYDQARTNKLRKEYIKRNQGGAYDFFHDTGTPALIGPNIVSGRCPVKNWAGVGVVDFKEGITEYDVDRVMSHQTRPYGCWKCTIACGGHFESNEPGPYQGVKADQPEYESAGAFGNLTLTANFPAIIKLNDLSNRFGFDTISAAGTIAFAIECFENGLLTEKDTDGVQLRWGNAEAIIAMLEKMAYRQGIGDLLAEGSQRAAAQIGQGAEQYAVQIGGQELPMHDPKYLPGYITTYILDATPGRHTQGGDQSPPVNFPQREYDAMSTDPHNRADVHQLSADLVHVMNAAGICLFGYLSYEWSFIPDFLEAITGWEWSLETMRKTGERIGTMRHLFNLREGINPLQHRISGRIVGDPPQAAGPLKGRTVDYKTMTHEYLEHLGWDPETTVPGKEKLIELGLDEMLPLFHPG
jgi:aldehyde:ferredoxin oxidoreductase